MSKESNRCAGCGESSQLQPEVHYLRLELLRDPEDEGAVPIFRASCKVHVDQGCIEQAVEKAAGRVGIFLEPVAV
jgi:hypothetical protein